MMMVAMRHEAVPEAVSTTRSGLGRRYLDRHAWVDMDSVTNVLCVDKALHALQCRIHGS